MLGLKCVFHSQRYLITRTDRAACQNAGELANQHSPNRKNGSAVASSSHHVTQPEMAEVKVGRRPTGHATRTRTGECERKRMELAFRTDVGTKTNTCIGAQRKHALAQGLASHAKGLFAWP